jgi:RNA polymerase sigma-70 factor (ECF subfamily)
MKAVDRPFASTSTTVDPQAETLRLFQEHGAALYRFCRSVLRHTGDAEDVVQETFLKLLHHLQHDGDTRNLKSWLFTVAANGCRDRTRWRLRWLPWKPSVTTGRLTDRRWSAEADTQVARKAFRALAPRDRLLIAPSAGTFIQGHCSRVRDPRAVGWPSAGASLGQVEETMRCLTDIEVQAVVDGEASDECARMRTPARRVARESMSGGPDGNDASLIDADGCRHGTPSRALA